MKVMNNSPVFRRADNSRVPKRGSMGGWDALRARLIGEEIDRPMIVCFDNCIDSIRTIPALQHDSNNLEDVDTDGEDHAGDEWRYACMSRPWAKPISIESPVRFPQHRTFNEIMTTQRRKREDA